jgi:Fe-S-cluster-containing dehydrogenase component
MMGMAKGEVIIDYQICMGCGICINACPFSCLDLTRYGTDAYKRLFPELEPDHGCTGCGICSKACPLECMTVIKKDKDGKKDAVSS